MSQKKLLVADDSITIQKVIRLALSNDGYEIQTISDGSEAVQQILMLKPDVVLIDVSLPNQNAFEVKQAVNALAELKFIRFILMSSAFVKVDEVLAKEVRFHARLTKPFDPGNLRNVLNEALKSIEFGQNVPMRPIPESPPFPIPGKPAITLQSKSTGASPLSTTAPVKGTQNENEFILEAPELDISAETLEMSETETEEEGFDSESDIRKLTESTIEMSSISEMQWNIREPALEPLPSMLDPKDKVMFRLSDLDEFKESPIQKAIPDAPSLSGFDFDSPNLDSPPAAMQPPEVQVPPAPVLSPNLSRVPLESAPAPTDHPDTLLMKTSTATQHEVADSRISISQVEIEKLVKKQVEETLTTITQALLPQLAEKLIKEEIHKMLSKL